MSNGTLKCRRYCYNIKFLIEFFLCLLLVFQEEMGAQTLFALGGVEFLQRLKADLPPDCQLVVNDILEQIFIKSQHTTVVASELTYSKSDAEKSGPTSKGEQSMKASSKGEFCTVCRLLM